MSGVASLLIALETTDRYVRAKSPLAQPPVSVVAAQPTKPLVPSIARRKVDQAFQAVDSLASPVKAFSNLFSLGVVEPDVAAWNVFRDTVRFELAGRTDKDVSPERFASILKEFAEKRNALSKLGYSLPNVSLSPLQPTASDSEKGPPMKLIVGSLLVLLLLAGIFLKR